MRRNGLLRRATLCAALIAITAAIFVGCGASITVYDYISGGVRYNEYEIAIENTAIELLEATATTDADGEKYTVAGYLHTLFTEFGYELTEATDKDGTYTVKYRKAIYGTSELDRYGTAVEFTATSTSDPFVRTITSVSPNPFNGVRKAYDGIPNGRSATILERVKNGLTVYNDHKDPNTVFPAIDQAFPYLKGADYDGLLLKFVRVGSDRMDSSGVATPLGNRTVRYEFSRYFDESETQITFEYKRAVPYGWYVVALILGAGVFVLLRYVAKRHAVKHGVTAEHGAENVNTQTTYIDADTFAATVSESATPQDPVAQNAEPAGAATQSDVRQGEQDNAQTE